MAIPIGPNFDWNAYRNNGNSTIAQPGSPNWNAALQQQQQQMMNDFQNQMRQIQQQYPVAQFNPSPSPQGSSARGGYSAGPTFTSDAGLPQPNGGRGAAAYGGTVAGQPAAGSYGDPNLDALVAQLRQQAGEADATLNDKAMRQIEAQRAVADRNINQMLQKSLAASGVLPTGGLAARFRDEIAKPIDERLNAYAADVHAGLRNERSSTANNLLSQLTSLAGQRNAWALDQQRFQLEQQRLAADLAAQQQRMAMAQQDALFQRQQAAFDQAMRNASLSSQLSMSAPRGGGGGGGGGAYEGLPMTGSVSGWNGGRNSFLESGVQPRDTYNASVMRGYTTNGQVGSNYNSAGNQALRLEQQQRAMQANPNSYQGYSGAAGAANGMIPYSQPTGASSAGSAIGMGLGGSATNISFGGGLSLGGSATGVPYGGISAANMGAIGGGYSMPQYGGGSGGGYGYGGQTYGGMPSGYGRSMY